MSASIVSSWRFLCQSFFQDRDQDLYLFLGGEGGGSSFIFSFKGTFSSSEESLSNCSMMMMNLQTLASLLVVQIISIWKKAEMNLHQLSLKATCGPFHGWNLQNLVQVVSTLKKAWVDPQQLNLEVTCLPFCNWNHQDHFSIWLPLTSLECQQV